MTVKLFVLGCSGSGKSTAARHITTLVRNQDLPTIHCNDYVILYEMFQDDMKKGYKRFCPAAFRGFDVVDPSVYDTALLQLRKHVQIVCSSSGKLFITIEFARANYRNTLKAFSKDFLQNAYFLYFDSDPHTCWQRILSRVLWQGGREDRDNHFVPPGVIHDYQFTANRQYLASGLKADYGIEDDRVKIIDNPGKFDDIRDKIDNFIEYMLRREGNGLK